MAIKRTVKKRAGSATPLSVEYSLPENPTPADRERLERIFHASVKRMAKDAKRFGWGDGPEDDIVEN